MDLAALDTFIEFKRRIGTAGGFNPNAEYVQQLDDYLERPERQDRMRMGILTDGRRWLLRWPDAGPVRTALPYALTLDDADRWITLFEWLRDHALSAERDKHPSRSAIAQHFGPTAPSYERDIAALKALYDQHANSSTIRVKRHLWENLLTAALGEIARSGAQLDDLFVRHTQRKRESFAAEYAVVADGARSTGAKIFFADEVLFQADAELRASRC